MSVGMSSTSSVSFLESPQILDQVKTLLTSSEEVDLAVAFLKDSGYREIRRDIINFIRNEKSLKLIVGLASYCITDPEPLDDLLKIRENLNARRRLLLKYYSNPQFHPKLLIFKEQHRICAIVGSSNFTAGGWGGNLEANILICGNSSDRVMRDIDAFFQRIWRRGARRITEKIVLDYQKMKSRSYNWNANRVKETRIRGTTIPAAKRIAVEIDTAYLVGLLLARGEASQTNIVIRIPCRQTIAREGHVKFARRKLLKVIAATLNERVKAAIQYNSTTRSVEISVESKNFIKIIRQLKIPFNQDFGVHGRVPRKILSQEERVIISFLQGYGDSCATVDRHISGKARIVLNLLLHGTGVIEGLVDAFEKSSVPLFDVNLPSIGGTLGRLFRKLERRLRTRVRVTHGTNTPQIRVWGDVYAEKIGFKNEYTRQKLKNLL